MKRNTFLKCLAGLPFLSFTTNKPTIKRNAVVEFTPEMLQEYNFGLYIIKDTADIVKNPDHAATVAWKLSWSSDPLLLHRYGLTNFLTDGWFCGLASTKEELCEYLNNNQHGNKYRIMTKEELFYILENKTNPNQLFYE